MKELLERYHALLRRAEKIIEQPPVSPNKEKWLDDWRRLKNEVQREAEQLSLWEGNRQPQRTLIKNETGVTLDVSTIEDNTTDLPTSIFILRAHKDGD